MKTFQKLNYIIVIVLMLLISCKEPETKVVEDFCSNIQKNKKFSLSHELASLEDKIDTKTGVYVLEDGGGALITRAWLSEYATESIDIQYFIFSLDNVGLIACDYLVRAADRGVKIRLLVDDFMIDADIKDILTLNSHKNISIKIYNPGVNIGKNLFSKITKFATDFRGANQRMHNKTFIVDKKIIITGGRNIADEYFDYDHEYNFRDREVLLLGKISKPINTSFETFWNDSLSTPISSLTDINVDNINHEIKFERLHQYACNPDNFWPQIRSKIDDFPNTIKKIKESGELIWVDHVEFVSDMPGKNDGKNGLGGGGLTTTALINLVKNAKNTIEIQTPYLITSDLSQFLFKSAIARGVKIRILTNSLASTDNLEAFASYQTDRKKLLKLGIDIYEFKPDARVRKDLMTGELSKVLEHQPVFGLHSKSMIIDNKIAVIGTFNLDPRSANLNTECIVTIYSSKIAQQVLKGMEVEFLEENAWHITLDFNPDSEVTNAKRIKTWTRKILPKGIL